VFNLGIGEIVVVLVVALVFLGPKMLPEIATGLGKVIREIRKATADIRQDIELDDMIRKPLQELRDAATLPPEELKRRDEARAAQRKAAEEEAKRKQQEAKTAEEAMRKQQEAEAAVQRQQRANEELAKAAAALPKPKPAASPGDVVSAGGTMIANPPPSDNLRTLTPLPELHSPPPVLTAQRPRLPPPPLPPPALPRPTSSSMKAATPADATVVDVQAQLNAAATAQATGAPRPAPAPLRTQPIPSPKRAPEPEGKKG
jgi:TatA/E family protein of Tat protein translocase